MSPIIFLVVAIAIVVMSLIIVFVLPGLFVETVPVSSFERRKEKLQNLLVTLLGGLGLLLTFAWNMGKDRDEAIRANRQESDRQFIEATKLLSRTDSERSTALRAAAAFALGNLARTDPSYRRQIRDILTAVIFDQLHGVTLTTNEMNPDPYLSVNYVTSDVNAALKVLGEGSTTSGDGFATLALNHANLVGARMARFRGLTKVSFQGARLNAADFRCSDLSGSDFSAAELSDYSALVPQQPESRPARDALQKGLEISKPSWEQYRKFDFIANFEGARLTGADFRGATIWGASYLNSADMTHVHFENVNISRVDFRRASNLDKAFFKGACADDEPAIDQVDGQPSWEHRNADGHIEYVEIAGQRITPCPGKTTIKDRAFFKPVNDTLSLSTDRKWCMEAAEND